MRGKKILLLGLALIFPVFIFLFLKFFGKNEFDVAPLYQTGPLVAPEGCQGNYSTPYSISDSVFRELTAGDPASLWIYHFFENEDSGILLAGALEEFKNDAIRTVTVKKQSSVSGQPEMTHDGDVIHASEKTIEQLRTCVLLMPADQFLVLVDSEKRIRGYYSSDREEIDRLVVELKIILRKF